MRIVHTLPLLIRDSFHMESDLEMLKICFYTLGKSEENTIVVYNQGILSDNDIQFLAQTYGLDATVIGGRTNVGIPISRQQCFEYVWNTFPEAEYISEIHVDMAFPVNWYVPLLDFLNLSDEPMISPGIMTQQGILEPEGDNGTKLLNENIDEFMEALEGYTTDETKNGFVHPAIHNAKVLQAVGGYDTTFLVGQQGFEDDSLLLGYLYYMGTRTNWRPKCYLKSRVYHAVMTQRTTLENHPREIHLNVNGLIQQYGTYGLKHLSEIHTGDSSEMFTRLHDSLISQRANRPRAD